MISFLAYLRVCGAEHVDLNFTMDGIWEIEIRLKKQFGLNRRHHACTNDLDS